MEDGEAVLATLGEAEFDLILLDVLMPELDGFQVLKKIKEDPALKDILVVMLTAKGQGRDIATGTELDADDYTVKPFNPDELVERVDRISEMRYGARKDTAS